MTQEGVKNERLAKYETNSLGHINLCSESILLKKEYLPRNLGAQKMSMNQSVTYVGELDRSSNLR
jgi:hypothetical protein